MSVDADLRAVRKLLEAGDLQRAASTCLAALRQHPNHVPAIELYARIAERLRRFDEAQIIYQKLLQAAPRNVLAHERLGLLYLEQGDHRRAGAHAQQALTLDPKLVSPCIVLGSLALLQGKVDQGDAFFAQALEHTADVAAVQRTYANALLTAGEFERASVLLRNLIVNAPDEAHYHELLSRAADLENSEEDANLILALLGEDGDLRAEVRRSPQRSPAAWHALHKLFDVRGDHSRAFQSLESAKEIRRGAANFDLGQQVRVHAALASVFSPEFVQSHQTVGCMAEDAIFVVGMPRAGTTLLERVLATDEQVAAGGELPIVQRLLQEACAAVGAHQDDYAALARLPGELWRQLGEEYIKRARAQVPAGRYFVDKDPGNTFLLGFIRTMLPRARIIHSVRHPAATCLSIYEQNFLHGHDYAANLQSLGEYYLHYNDVIAYWKSLYPGDIIDMHYEALVSDGDRALETLRQRLQLDAVSFSLEADRNGGEIRTASVRQARQNVHTQSMDRWHNYRVQLQPLLTVLAPLLQEPG